MRARNPDWEKKHRATKFLESGSYAKEKVLWVWELSQIQKLSIPIPYVHPQGALIWVDIKKIEERRSHTILQKY